MGGAGFNFPSAAAGRCRSGRGRRAGIENVYAGNDRRIHRQNPFMLGLIAGGVTIIRNCIARSFYFLSSSVACLGRAPVTFQIFSKLALLLQLLAA